MDRCDVLIVGAGPAGSACAWQLRRAGLQVILLDRERFPRNKVCGGWITPAVLDELEIDPQQYARGRVLQPITGFRVGAIGGAGHEISYHRTISYGIRRCEFDDYLVRRSGAQFAGGVALESLERTDDGWNVNARFHARVVVGAGGHFCPVARYLGAKGRSEVAVVAQEMEFPMDAAQRAQCAVRGEVPELYFCPDLRGYGWCFRKQNFLNIGLGRLGEHRLGSHVAEFLAFLKQIGRVEFALPGRPAGHAYLLYCDRRQAVAGDAVLLVGDAAGLAYSQSGEGIRPAIESGLLAADTIVEAAGCYDGEQLLAYHDRLAALFGEAQRDWASAIGRHLSPGLIRQVARPLLASRWFARSIILDRWFLHADVPPLATGGSALRVASPLTERPALPH